MNPVCYPPKRGLDHACMHRFTGVCSMRSEGAVASWARMLSPLVIRVVSAAARQVDRGTMVAERCFWNIGGFWYGVLSVPARLVLTLTDPSAQGSTERGGHVRSPALRRDPVTKLGAISKAGPRRRQEFRKRLSVSKYFSICIWLLIYRLGVLYCWEGKYSCTPSATRFLCSFTCMGYYIECDEMFSTDTIALSQGKWAVLPDSRTAKFRAVVEPSSSDQTSISCCMTAE